MRQSIWSFRAKCKVPCPVLFAVCRMPTIHNYQFPIIQAAVSEIRNDLRVEALKIYLLSYVFWKQWSDFLTLLVTWDYARARKEPVRGGNSIYWSYFENFKWEFRMQWMGNDFWSEILSIFPFSLQMPSNISYTSFEIFQIVDDYLSRLTIPFHKKEKWTQLSLLLVIRNRPVAWLQRRQRERVADMTWKKSPGLLLFRRSFWLVTTDRISSRSRMQCFRTIASPQGGGHSREKSDCLRPRASNPPPSWRSTPQPDPELLQQRQ